MPKNTSADGTLPGSANAGAKGITCKWLSVQIIIMTCLLESSLAKADNYSSSNKMPPNWNIPISLPHLKGSLYWLGNMQHFFKKRYLEK